MERVMITGTTARPTNERTDLITVLLGTWLMLGLFLDGYAHTNFIDELESFLTPWHAVFYSGFIATALWVIWTIAGGWARQGAFGAPSPPGMDWPLSGS
jgi:hypothetical protein